MGHLQLVRKSDLTQEQNRRVETALRKAERMKELMETFYDLSLIDSEQAAPVKERINFSNLILDFLTENAPLLEAEISFRISGCLAVRSFLIPIGL